MLITSHRVEDTSARYVAEDNIVLLTSTEFEELDNPMSINGVSEAIILACNDDLGDEDVYIQPRRSGIVNRFPIEIGRFFKRFDPEQGVFVSNMLNEYPED